MTLISEDSEWEVGTTCQACQGTGVIQGLQEFVLKLRRPTWDIEDDWRQFLTRDAGGQICCWRLKSHFQYQVGTS